MPEFFDEIKAGESALSQVSHINNWMAQLAENGPVVVEKVTILSDFG